MCAIPTTRSIRCGPTSKQAVCEGSHRWKQTFNADGPLFSSFFRTEAATREFMQGMHGFGQLCSPAVVAAFDLSRFEHLVDLGGATGHLAEAARSRYPNLRTTVFDLPQVAALFPNVTPGDFFEDPLPPADLYVCGRILHDWSEEKIDRLLRKVYAALPAGGGFLIAEKLLDETNVPGAHAESEHAGLHRRQRAHRGRIRGPAEARRIFHSREPPDGHSARCHAGREVIVAHAPMRAASRLFSKLGWL